MKTTLYMREITLYMLIFLSGAFGYGLVELLYRGYTHWSMIIVGGACLLSFYFIEKGFPNAGIVTKAIIGALIVTFYEFFVGCIVNLHFGLGVWDYHDQPFSLLGQICPAFSFLWFLLCLCLAWIYRFLYNVTSRSG